MLIKIKEKLLLFSAVNLSLKYLDETNGSLQ